MTSREDDQKTDDDDDAGMMGWFSGDYCTCGHTSTCFTVYIGLAYIGGRTASLQRTCVLRFLRRCMAAQTKEYRRYHDSL